MKIGLISDTHSYLDPQIYHYLSDCEEIWHAGDIGKKSIFSELEAFKKIRAVWGNIDGHELRTILPEYIYFGIEGLSVLMIHIGGYPGKYSPKAKSLIQELQPKLFISGHSHIVKIIPDTKNQLLHINPGACGIEGWHKVKTIVRFDIQMGKISQMELIEFGPRGR